MPLKNVKVLELAGLAPAPFCGMVLADYGASVVRVDKAKDRAIPDELAHGKRSIILNLKSETGKSIFKRLSDHSDVIIDPYRKGVMDKLNLGPQVLMASNERLIYARLTGFGQNGLYSSMAGHDINFLGLSGLLSLFGRYNEKPLPPVNFAADFAGGGLMCALSIVMALYERSQSKMGQVIDVSMTEGVAYVGSWFFRTQNISGIWGNPRGRNMLDTGTHFYDTYETKDGKYMAVGAIEPKFYAVLLEKLGLTDDELPHYFDFEKNREKLTTIFKEKSQEEWCTIFDGSDACVTPILTLKEATIAKHNRENESFKVSTDGTMIPNPAGRLSRTPGVACAARKHNAVAGENTREILLEYGFDPNEIDNVIASGAVEEIAKRSKL